MTRCPCIPVRCQSYQCRHGNVWKLGKFSHHVVLDLTAHHGFIGIFGVHRDVKKADLQRLIYHEHNGDEAN